jgi:predicted metal-dependent phosphoesterase TrpH
MAVNIAQASASPLVAAQNQQALRQVWENIQPDSCPHAYNFHMHTIYSDGQLKPQDLVQQALAIGLKGFAITDHHTIAGYKLAQSWLQYWQQQSSPSTPFPHLWTGVEINADLLGTEVHILGYAFDPEHPSIKPYLQGKAPQHSDAQAAAVIVALHQAGGLAVLAHPARYRRSAQELIPVAAHLGIDGVETYYAYNNPDPWQPSPTQTQQVKMLSATYNLLNTCGTDTHSSNLLRRL